MCSCCSLNTALGCVPNSALSMDCNMLNGRKCVGGSQTGDRTRLTFPFFFLFCEGV